MRLKKLLLAGLFSGISLLCFAQGLTVSDSIFSGGMFRKYRVYIPAIYSGSQPVPLVLNLHGYTSNSIQQQVYSNFMPIADTANFLLVYPDGSTTFGGQFWNANITSVPDDVQFLSELIDRLEQDYNIDFKRVYSCGMSNGGIMSYFLACGLHQRIAAIASVTGTMFRNWYGSCSPPRPIPIMEIHGTVDATVPYAGDANFAPVDSVIQKWVQHNACNPVPVTFSVPNTNAGDNSTAVNYRYLNGSNGSSVELYKVSGGGHSWPGAIPVFANTNQDFNASAEIWRFFRKYDLGQFISNVGRQDYHAEPAVSAFPNPVSDLLLLRGADHALVSLAAPDGRTVISEQPYVSGVSVSDLPGGIYFLQVKQGSRVKVLRVVKN